MTRPSLFSLSHDKIVTSIQASIKKKIDSTSVFNEHEGPLHATINVANCNQIQRRPIDTAKEVVGR